MIRRCCGFEDPQQDLRLVTVGQSLIKDDLRGFPAKELKDEPEGSGFNKRVATNKVFVDRLRAAIPRS